MSQALKQSYEYTEEDYYNLPENERAELIDGQLYFMSAPSRIHQEVLSFLHVEIANHIRSKKGAVRYTLLRLQLSCLRIGIISLSSRISV